MNNYTIIISGPAGPDAISIITSGGQGGSPRLIGVTETVGQVGPWTGPDRWTRISCPVGETLLYLGKAAGSWYQARGGAAVSLTHQISQQLLLVEIVVVV